MSRNPVLYKYLVVGVIVLFFGMSVNSSTVGIAEDKSSNIYFLESANNPIKPLPCDHTAYVIGDAPDYHLYEFILNDPGNLTCICEGSSVDIFHVTWSWDNYIYFTQYGPEFFYVIDIDSCELYIIGGSGQSLTGGIAYDLTTNRMFGVWNTGLEDYLIEVDPDTGEQELIGSLGDSVYPTVGIAFDSEGKFYGWSFGHNKLWTIDFETWNVTIVGDLGFNINYTYTCDGDFCKEDDKLYIAHENKLYMYDLDEGQCELIDEFPDNVTVTGLAIPNEDTTPPVTTHTLDPPYPDGNNGWYVSDVNVTLTATDDISGVKVTYYRIDNGNWIVYTEPFTLSEDGDDILIEYRAIDIAGNVETKNSFLIDIDKTVPEIALTYEVIGGNVLTGWFFEFTACAVDEISGMDCVEFYLNGEIMATIHGPGPDYTWIYHWPGLSDTKFRVRGFICNLEITDEYVDFYALMVKISYGHLEEYDFIACGYDNAGNKDCDGLVQPTKPLDTISPGFYMFRKFTLPNDYTGHIGRFFIYATFIYG